MKNSGNDVIIKSWRDVGSLPAIDGSHALRHGEHEPELVAKAITIALDGDVTALKLCLERLEPPRRRPRTVAHPEVEALLDGSADLDAIGLAVMKAVHRNELDPDDAYATVEMLLARKRLAAKSAEPLPEIDGDPAAKLRELAALVGYEVVPKVNGQEAPQAPTKGSGNGAGS